MLTGATGFVGGALASRLAQEGWSVHAMVRASSEWRPLEKAGINCHVYDGSYDSLERAADMARPQILFHLAAQLQTSATPQGAETLLDANVRFPMLLVEAVVAKSCLRMVNTGTFWQTYNGEAYNPLDLYAATKQAFEDLLRYYHEVRGLSCVNLRLHDNYGPGDPRLKIMNLLIRAGKEGTPLPLSPGEQILDLTHVDDLVDAFVAAGNYLLAAGEPKWETTAVSGERMSLKEIVALVSSAFGGRLPAVLGARSYREREMMKPLDAPPGAALSGWTRRRSLEETLPALIAHFDPHSQWIRGRR
jgi:nucleoside-diphosphate-sugar epimerase